MRDESTPVDRAAGQRSRVVEGRERPRTPGADPSRIFDVEEAARPHRALDDVFVVGERHDLVDRPAVGDRDVGAEHEHVDPVEPAQHRRVHGDHAVPGEPAVELGGERLPSEGRRLGDPDEKQVRRPARVAGDGEGRRSSPRASRRPRDPCTARPAPPATASGAARRSARDGGGSRARPRSRARAGSMRRAERADSPTMPERCAMSTTRPNGPCPSACESALAVTNVTSAAGRPIRFSSRRRTRGCPSAIDTSPGISAGMRTTRSACMPVANPTPTTSAAIANT